MGHLGRLAPLAQALHARGHEITLAVKDVSGVGSVVGLDAFRVVQAPVWLKSGDTADPPLSYAEILARFGYADRGGLGGMLRAWGGLLALVKPDIVVADHAPTALLAARVAALPRVTYGSGFFLPPRVYPLPNMRPWHDIPVAQLAASEDILLAGVNRVLSTLRAPPLARLAEVLTADADFLMTFRELDHYRGRRDGEYLGVASSEGANSATAWPDGAGKKILAYLHGDYREMEAILNIFNKLEARVLLFAPGIAPAMREKFGSSRLVFSSRPLALSAMGRQCDVTVCHGGLATTVAALRAGCPLLLLPLHLEQFLMSMNVESLGAGLMINPDLPNPDAAGVLRRLLKESSFKARALDFADRYADYDPASVLKEIANRCEAVIASHNHGRA
jgi:UDP:flavonoid glycosyltransferase YjiC (YdhE family)